MTFKEMRDQVQYWLGLQDIQTYDETQMIGQLLHQGTIDLLARTRCVVRCLDLRVLAGQSTYTLDHMVVALVDVENGSRPKARRDQTLYPSFTLIRADVLRVQPTPSEDGEIQVWAVLRPQKMAADTDSPGMEAYGAIPDEYQDAIVTYALWKAGDYSDDGTSTQGERYRVLYEGEDGRSGRLAQIRSSVNKRGTARAPERKVRIRPVRPSSAWIG